MGTLPAVVVLRRRRLVAGMEQIRRQLTGQFSSDATGRLPTAAAAAGVCQAAQELAREPCCAVRLLSAVIVPAEAAHERVPYEGLDWHAQSPRVVSIGHHLKRRAKTQGREGEKADLKSRDDHEQKVSGRREKENQRLGTHPEAPISLRTIAADTS